jgi:hypothetical protein
MEAEDGDDEIAAAMGFSSFGHSKKRKFDQTNSPKAKADASGANMTRLGVRTKVAAEEDGTELDAATQAVESIEAIDPAANSQSESHPPASNTSVKGKGKQKQKQKQPAATGLAAFLSRGQTLPEKSSAAQPGHDATTAIPVAQADPAASETISFGGEPISRSSLNALRSGVRVENGDTAYFLPSFVEDPWERIKSRE